MECKETVQLRWSHAFVHVESMETMLGFYTDVLGFEIADRGEVGGRRVAFLSQVETDHHQLAFLERPSGEAPAPPGRVGHFAFRVDSLQDVKALHGRLQADERVKSVAPITHGNAWSIYFADPEGNGIEVFCDSPWHVRQPQGKAWDPSATEAELREATLEEFGQTEGFGAIDDYYMERRRHCRERSEAKETP